jgi:hypothetical protein
MTRSPLRREAFDAGRDFQVTRHMTISGTKFLPGHPFDKKLVSTRRLRQLFDQRCLAMLPGMGAEAPLTPAKPDFGALPEEAIKDWLKVHGVVPRFGWPHDRLVEAATGEWNRRFLNLSVSRRSQ